MEKTPVVTAKILAKDQVNCSFGSGVVNGGDEAIQPYTNKHAQKSQGFFFLFSLES